MREGDLRDAAVNYAVDVVDIPVAQEFESASETIRGGVNRWVCREGGGDRCSRHITERIESELISDYERTADERWRWDTNAKRPKKEERQILPGWRSRQSMS